MLIWHVFSQVCLPIFLMLSLGWVLDRKFDLNLDTLVKLNIYLFVPAFIFVQIVGSQVPAALAVKVIALTLTVIALMFLLSGLIGRLSSYTPPQIRSLQLATMFYNSGNYGIPLMTLAFPVSGPLIQVFIILTQNISTFSIGLLLTSTSGISGWKKFLPMLRQVSLWAIVAAFLVRVFHIPVMQSAWLWTPLTYFSAALVGVALITLGAQLSKTPRVQHWPRLGWAVSLRLLISPILAFGLVRLFGFQGETASIIILSTSFPTAVNTALLAHEFKADSHFAAAAVFYSTVFSMVTVTILVAILKVM